MDISSANIGPEATEKVSISAGKITVAVNYNGQETGASVNVSVSVDTLLAEIEAKVGSTIGKEAIELLRGAIKAIN